MDIAITLSCTALTPFIASYKLHTRIQRKVTMALGPQIVAVDAGEKDRHRGGDHIEKNDSK